MDATNGDNSSAGSASQNQDPENQDSANQDSANQDSADQALANSTSQAEPTFEVVWPRSALGIQQHRLADRLDSLDGKTIGFLWDHLFRGDELFPVLAKQLVERFERVEIVSYEEFGNTHGGDEAEVIAGLPDRLHARHVDAVVSGMGC